MSNNFSLEDVLIDENDIALLQYTGGTTGKSKAAILTHRNLLSNVQQVSNWIEPHVEQVGNYCHSFTVISHFFIYSQLSHVSEDWIRECFNTKPERSGIFYQCT